MKTKRKVKREPTFYEDLKSRPFYTVTTVLVWLPFIIIPYIALAFVLLSTIMICQYLLGVRP